MGTVVTPARNRTRPRPSGQLRCAVLATLFLFGCVEEGGDRVWGLGETRSLSHGAQAPPPSRPSSGDFRVFVPLGIERERVVASADASLVVESGASVVLGARSAILASRGRLQLQREAQVGAVYGGSSTQIENGAALGGYLKVCGALDLGRALVRVGVLRGVACDSDEYSWQVRFPALNAGNRATHATDGQPLKLAPGAYGSIEVGADSELELRTGTYYLDALTVAGRGVLQLNNVDGPIYVWIRSSVTIQGELLDFWQQPSIMFGYAGVEPAIVTNALRGTWLAPASHLVLPRTERVHSGAFFAKSLTIAANARVEHRAFAVAPPPNARAAPAKIACAACAAAASAVAERCCARREHAMDERDGADARCAAACSGDASELVACRTACRSASLPDARRTQAWFDACLQSGTFALSECEEEHGYRPDTCERLGWAPTSSSCEY